MADLDPADYRKRVMLKAGASPGVWLPAGVGVLTILVGAAASWGVLLVGVGLVAVGAAWYGVRLLGRTGEMGEAVAADVAGERGAAKAGRLDALARRAEVLGDREVATAAFALRRAGGRLDKAAAWGEAPSVGLEVAVDVLGKARQLYDSCLASLETSLALRTAAGEMATEEGRTRAMKARQALLDEVEGGIGRIGLALDRLQAAAVTHDVEGDLPRLREELDAGLAIARRVEQRMGELERSADGSPLAGPRDLRD